MHTENIRATHTQSPHNRTSQAYIETGRGRHTYIHTYTYTQRHKHIQSDIHDRQSVRQTSRQTYTGISQKYRQADIQGVIHIHTYRQTDSNAYIHKYINTYS